MAYVQNYLDDEEELKKQQNASQLLNTPTSSSSFVGQSQTNSTPQKTNSGWTNLRSYLDANQDQSLDLASKVSGKINEQGLNAKNNIDQASTNYKNLVGSNNIVPDQNLIQSAVNDPVLFSQNKSNVDNFLKMKNASYNGPDVFESQPDYGTLATGAQAAADLVSNVQSTGGQKELLRKLNPNLGSGQLDLDQLLLAGNPQSQQAILSAAQPFKNLTNYLSGISSENNALRNTAINNAKNSRDSVNSQFTTPATQTYTDLKNSLNKRSSDYNVEKQNLDSQINDLSSLIRGSNKGSDLSPQLKSTFFDLNPQSNYIADPNTDFLSRNFSGTSLSQGDVNPLTVSTPQEAAKIIALQQLLQNNEDLFNGLSSTLSGTYKRPVVGKYQPPTISNNPGVPRPF